MDAAFAFVEAGPAAGSLALAVGYGTGAGLATDGAVAAGGEGVHGEVVLLDVILHLVARPSGHGIQFDDVAVAEDIKVVEFDDAGVLSRVILLAAQAGDPDIERGEFFLQRNDLAERTAQVRLGFPKLGTEFGGLLGDRLLGVQGFDGNSEAFLDLGLQLQRFGKQEAGVDGENGKAESVRVGRVHGDEAGALEAGSKGRALAEGFPGPREDFPQAGGLEFLGLAPNHVAVLQRGHGIRNSAAGGRRIFRNGPRGACRCARGGRGPRDGLVAGVAQSDFAASTTLAAVMPSCSITTLPGALRPKRSMATAFPSRPT